MEYDMPSLKKTSAEWAYMLLTINPFSTNGAFPNAVYMFSKKEF